MLVSHGEEMGVGELFRTPNGLRWFVEGAWHPIGRWPFWLPPPGAPLRVLVTTTTLEEEDDSDTWTLRLLASVNGFPDEVLESSADAETRALPGWSWTPAISRLLVEARARLARRFGIAPEAILFEKDQIAVAG